MAHTGIKRESRIMHCTHTLLYTFSGNYCNNVCEIREESR
jgi:hypothetical protein